MHDQLPAPVAKVRNDAVGHRHGFMTTVHSYTHDQPPQPLDQVATRTSTARAAAPQYEPESTVPPKPRAACAAGTRGQA